MDENFKRKSEFFNKPHFLLLRTHSRFEKQTVENSLGIFGEIKKLPFEEVLQLTTMCGHGMVPANLVAKVVAEIKKGEKTMREGAVELTRPCHCGIYNPVRAERLLTRLVPFMVLDAKG